MPNEILSFLSNINESTLIYILIAVYVIFYLLIFLLTSSKLKPLLYLGIPTLLSGLFLLFIRLFSNYIVTMSESKLDAFIPMILPKILKPIFTFGIFFSLLGIVMIIIYKVCKNQKIEIQKEVF